MNLFCSDGNDCKKEEDDDMEQCQIQKKTTLTMLAHVASNELHNDRNGQKGADHQLKKRRVRGLPGLVTAGQLISLSANQLVRLFATPAGDEMRRSYSFTCQFEPGCRVTYSSFASELKAKAQMNVHLRGHLGAVQQDSMIEVPSRTEVLGSWSVRTSSKSVRLKEEAKSVDEATCEVVRLEPISVEYFTETVVDEKPVMVEEVVGIDWVKTGMQTGAEEGQWGKDKVLYEDSWYCEERALKPADWDHNYCSAPARHPAAPSRPQQQVYILNGLHELTNALASHYLTADAIAESGLFRGSMFSDNPLVVGEEVEVKSEPLEKPIRKNKVSPMVQVNRSESEGCEDQHQAVGCKPKGKAKFIGQSAAEREMALRLIRAVEYDNHGLQSLVCTICVPPRTFTASTTLFSHYRSHAGIKPYECHLCGAVFTRQHSLNYHLLIHGNRTRFTCAECGRKFRHPSHFKEHLRRHTGEAPFECADCYQRFKTRNTYKRHLKTRHGKVLTQEGDIITFLAEEEEGDEGGDMEELEGGETLSVDKENSHSVNIRSAWSTAHMTSTFV